MKALVRMHDQIAGILERDGQVTRFQYDQRYLREGKPPLSLSLPLQSEPFESQGLLPYFSGLASEGWLKRIQCFEQGLNPDDDFARLVQNGKDLAGAVTIEPVDQ